MSSHSSRQQPSMASRPATLRSICQESKGTSLRVKTEATTPKGRVKAEVVTPKRPSRLRVKMEFTPKRVLRMHTGVGATPGKRHPLHPLSPNRSCLRGFVQARACHMNLGDILKDFSLLGFAMCFSMRHLHINYVIRFNQLISVVFSWFPLCFCLAPLAFTPEVFIALRVEFEVNHCCTVATI